MGEEHRDFFISYTSADRTWAEWIAWELEAAGYTTLIQAWDFRPGTDWATKMQEGTTEWCRILAVLSPRFFESKFTSTEWGSAFAKDPTGELGLLIPVRVEECELPGLLRARTYVDLVGLAEDAGRKNLLNGVKQRRAKPAKAPSFPGSAKPKPEFPPTKIETKRQTKEETSRQTQIAPAAPRTIHNLPFAPNPAFTGRAAELKKLHAELQKRVGVAVSQMVAVHGLGGLGKTQLAIEYSWKYLGDYDAVLWVTADSPKALDTSLSALTSLLDLPQANEREQDIQIKAVLGWLQGHERWLLIADNADTEPAAMAIRDRFPPNLRGAVLVTSRLSRWPVNMPNLPLKVLSREDAVRYLLDRVAKEEHKVGDEAAAHVLADELGHLPLALEQAASFIVEMRWSFAKYQEQFRDTRPELLSEHREGGTRYPASVAKTWSITLDQLGSLARSLLRIAAWFAPDAIPRSVFSAERNILAEALSEKVTISDLAIEKALGELDKFSFIRLTAETVSMHPLLQAVEQDSMGADERERWFVWAARLFNAFAPASPNDVRTWDVWLPLSPHAQTLIEHTIRHGIDSLSIAVVANQFGLFLNERAAYAQAEPLFRRALAISEKQSDQPFVAT